MFLLTYLRKSCSLWNVPSCASCGDSRGWSWQWSVCHTWDTRAAFHRSEYVDECWVNLTLRTLWNTRHKRAVSHLHTRIIILRTLCSMPCILPPSGVMQAHVYNLNVFLQHYRLRSTYMEQSSYQHHSINLFAIFQETTFLFTKSFPSV